MNCRQVEAKMADWSADNLPESFCGELREHLRACPACAHSWSEWQQTLVVISTATQPLCPAERSRAMWQHCEQHIQKKTSEAVRRAPSRSARAWWDLSPRLGFASLAGACAILAAVWLAPPSVLHFGAGAKPSDPMRLAANVTDTTQSDAKNGDEWIRFATPPAQASPFIDHHAAMAFDPFADHVASTFVSDAATHVTSEASSDDVVDAPQRP